MKLSRQMLNKAVGAKIISEQQAHQLMDFFKNLPEQSPEFNLTNVLYYFGGLLAIGAMSLFMNLGWDLYGGGAILLLSLSYALLGIAVANLLAQKGYRIPAGICATFVICLTPLAIYGFQRLMGWWPPDGGFYQDYHRYIKWHWIYMELGTLAVGVIMAWFYRYPFMVMPIAFTLWYMSMDLTSMLQGEYSVNLGAKVSLYFGLVTLFIALWVDFRSRDSGDYAFWLYIFGVMTFWGGLSSLSSDSELSKFFYMCINLLMILTGVVLNRKVFVVFGAFGCFYYLSHLAFQVFQYSYLFPVALTLMAVGIIYLGILWQKNESKMMNKMRSFLPPALKDLLESRE